MPSISMKGEPRTKHTAGDVVIIANIFADLCVAIIGTVERTYETVKTFPITVAEAIETSVISFLHFGDGTTGKRPDEAANAKREIRLWNIFQQEVESNARIGKWGSATPT